MLSMQVSESCTNHRLRRHDQVLGRPAPQAYLRLMLTRPTFRQGTGYEQCKAAIDTYKRREILLNARAITCTFAVLSGPNDRTIAMPRA